MVTSLGSRKSYSSTVLLCTVLVIFMFGIDCGYSMTTTYTSWEHCYYEDASPTTQAQSARLQIVRSVTNKLGVQFWSNINFLKQYENVILKLKVWQETDGSNTKVQSTDISQFIQKEDLDNDVLFGNVSGMMETLIPEVASKYEAEFQIFAEVHNPETNSIVKEEIVCLIINFELRENDLQQLFKQRNQSHKEL